MNQWAQVVDPVSGRLYYANSSTGETSWSSPSVHFFPPPPPPQLGVAAQQHHHVIGISCVAPYTTILPAAQLQHQCTQPLTVQQNANINALHSSNYSVTYQLDPLTATTPGLLVPSLRAIIDKEQAQTAQKQKIELEGVSAGTIADLCNVSREWRSRNVDIDGGDFAGQGVSTHHDQKNESQSSAENDEAANYYYMPLQPFSLALQSRPPHIEPGRVDIRMHALYSKLRSLTEKNNV